MLVLFLRLWGVKLSSVHRDREKVFMFSCVVTLVVNRARERPGLSRSSDLSHAVSRVNLYGSC